MSTNSPSSQFVGTLPFIAANSRWLAGGLFLTIFSSFGQTFFISIFAAEIRSTFNLSHGDFGGLYMLATLASAITLVFLGKIVDQYSTRWVGVFVCTSLATACVIMSQVNSVLMLLIALFTLRLFGQGMMTHVAMTAMGRWYSAERGRAVSIAAVGHHIGEGTLPLAAVLIVAAVGWRTSWLLAAASLLLIAAPVIFLLMRKERIPRHHKDSEQLQVGKQWTRGEVIRDQSFWLACLGVLAPAFIGTSFYFHQVHIAQIKGWPPTLIASGFSVLAVTTVIFGLVSGWLIDRFSAKRMLAVPLLPLGLSCWVLSEAVLPETLYVYMVILGLSYGFSSSIFSALWPEIFGVKHLGAIRAFVMALLVFSSALGPGVTGWFIDYGVTFASQLKFMTAYCVLTAGVMIVVSRRFWLRELAPGSAHLKPEAPDH